MAFSSLDTPSVMMVSIVFIIFVASSGINRLSILRIRTTLSASTPYAAMDTTSTATCSPKRA